MDQTETMWVIFLTKKKNLLTKISSLKAYGKLKIEELKILYGRKKIGGWTFRIQSQPKAGVFSFHDGDVVLKTRERYILLRSYSGYVYVFLSGVLWLGLCWFLFQRLYIQRTEEAHQEEPEITTTESVVVVQSIVTPSVKPEKIKKTVSRKSSIPKLETHSVLLEAKRDFQSGNITKSLKLLKPYMNQFDSLDQNEANQLMSEIFYSQCRRWSDEHEDRKAVIHCEKSVSFYPHTKAENFLNVQDEKAKKLYFEGYTAAPVNSAVAKQKFQEVLQTARTKSQWRNKAQYQLRKLK